MSSFYQRGAEKRREEMRLKEQDISSSCPPPSPRPMSPKVMEQEKRMRREIANSNERRRMQSINAGFESLKGIIPHQEGEKLSKAAILQHTTDHICQLEHDKAELLSENNQLRQMLREMGRNPELRTTSRVSPLPKRKKRDTESSDEGIGLTEDHHGASAEDTKREVMELRRQVELERKNRKILEEKCQSLEAKMKRAIGEEVPKDETLLMGKWTKEMDVEAAEHVPRPSSTPSPPPSADRHTTTAAGNTTVAPFLAQVHNVNNCLSLSRRNLDTIVEAIRHLEGDAVLSSSPCQDERSVPECCTKSSVTSHIPHSEESGTESSYDSEGSDSPAHHSPMDCDGPTSHLPVTSLDQSQLRTAPVLVTAAPTHQLPLQLLPASYHMSTQLPPHLLAQQASVIVKRS